MTTLSVSIPGTPLSVNHYAKHGGGAHYERKESKGFKRDVVLCLLAQTTQEQRDTAKAWRFYEVTLRIFLGAKQKGDLDNFAKLPLDGLTLGGVLHSDAAITRLIMEKSRDPENPRTEIQVKETVA